MIVDALDEIGSSEQFFLIAGPCVVESESLCLEVAQSASESCSKLGIPYIFKSSYNKANRSRLDSFRGIGTDESLAILRKVKKEIDVPILTDVHLPEECSPAAEVADVLQIPAFLSRQTDLLLAAGNTGAVVNIKKGQFLSPGAMQFAAEKVKSTSARDVWLTERGTTFGYGDLVVDIRSIPIMQGTGCPVVLDVTHSLQQPNQSSGVTGGQPEMIETLAKAGIAAGADGLFIETHPDPKRALSDGANMLALDKLESLLEKLANIRRSITA